MAKKYQAPFSMVKKQYPVKARGLIKDPVTPPGVVPETGTVDRPCGLDKKNALLFNRKQVKGRKVGKKKVPTCWVQLAWIKGKPHLRFCGNRGEPAPVVPVKNAKHARDLANAYCKCVEEKGKNCVTTVSVAFGTKQTGVAGIRKLKFRRL